MIYSRPSRYPIDQGSTTVEASIILSALLLLIVGTIEFGRALWTENTMLLAVQEAGRFAMINNDPPVGCGPQSQAPSCPAPSNTPLANCAAALAHQVLSAYQAAANIDISVREDQSSTPATITVCASHSFGFTAPGVLPYGPLNLKSQVTVPLVGNH